MAKHTASSCVTGRPGVCRSTHDNVRFVRTTTECRICRGELELALRGESSMRSPAAFKPSCHVVGVHGDLYRCSEWGTVHQPSLPQGNELHDLYREMSDDSYLVEEAGRRRTARRLLDLLAAHVASGRLLEVGCGHGLLLDEARRRGYERSRDSSSRQVPCRMRARHSAWQFVKQPSKVSPLAPNATTRWCWSTSWSTLTIRWKISAVPAHCSHLAVCS